MKKLAVFISIVTMVLGVAGMNEVFALDLGQNITIFDGVKSNADWHGEQEDNETEPGTVTNQDWDLEAFFLDGTTLSMVGGYDFLNGESGNGHTFRSGDIFIDVDGDAIYGPSNDGSGSVQNGHSIVTNSFGYDYVLDLDFANPDEGLRYYIYAIDENTSVKTVYYDINQESNPWQYESGGELKGSGIITYQAGLSDSALGLGLLGGAHNVVSVDLGFLGADIDNFTAHFTMECGNDNLMGRYDPVPEPSTVLLLGAGLLGVIGIGRKRIKK